MFLHGYGADGNDLIEIGRAWQGLLPHAAFVSPHAPEPAGLPYQFASRLITLTVHSSLEAIGFLWQSPVDWRKPASA